MHEITYRQWDWTRVPPGMSVVTIPNQHGPGKDGLALDRTDSIGKQIIAYCIKNSDGFAPGRDHPFKKMILKESGSAPNVDFQYRADRITVKTPEFEKRCREGEIIINPYTTYFGYVRAEPTYEVTTSRDVGSSNLWGTRDSLFNFNLFWQGHCPYQPSMRRVYHSSSYSTMELLLDAGIWQRPSTASRSIPLVETTIRSSGSFAEFTNVSPSFVIDDIVDVSTTVSMDHIKIQECLASANAGDVDALTAIAELPETLQSIVDGGKMLKKIFLDWKKGIFKLHSRADALSKAIAQREYINYRKKKISKFPPYQKWLRRGSNRRLDNPVLAYNTARKDFIDSIIERDQWINQRIGRFKAQARHELADAFASVHLNARYNIQTNVYLLQDIGEAVMNYGSEFKRYREKKVTVGYDFDRLFRGFDWSFSGTNLRTERVFIKRQYDVSDALKKLGRALMSDVVVTGVELIRLWSIVFDWFFTISNCLKAINWNPQYLQQGSSYSVKTEIEGTLSVNIDGKDQPLNLEVKYNGYKRYVINPSASIGLYWDPDFSLIRQLDALAFFWSTNRGTLRTYYAR